MKEGRVDLLHKLRHRLMKPASYNSLKYLANEAFALRALLHPCDFVDDSFHLLLHERVEIVVAR